MRTVRLRQCALQPLARGQVAGLAVDHRQAPAHAGEDAKAQHINLEHAQHFDIVFIPLHHRAVGHGGVFDGYQIA